MSYKTFVLIIADGGKQYKKFDHGFIDGYVQDGGTGYACVVIHHRIVLVPLRDLRAYQSCVDIKIVIEEFNSGKIL